MKTIVVAFCFSIAYLAPPPAFGQQRPLVTEDPETIGAGRILIEAGFDYGADQLFPVSGLTGDLLRVPLIGISVGVSSIAEIQIDGGLYNRLKITAREPAPLSEVVDVSGDTTTDVEDSGPGHEGPAALRDRETAFPRIPIRHTPAEREQ